MSDNLFGNVLKCYCLCEEVDNQSDHMPIIVDFNIDTSVHLKSGNVLIGST